MISNMKNRIIIGLSVFGIAVGSNCVNCFTSAFEKETYKNEPINVVCKENEDKTLKLKNDEVVNRENIKCNEQEVKNDNKSETVYITKSGKCYHKEGCKHLKKSSIQINVNNAIDNNYSPCKTCHK